MSEINELRKIQDVYSLFSRCMPYVIDYLPHKFFFFFPPQTSRSHNGQRTEAKNKISDMSQNISGGQKQLSEQ